MNETHQFYCHDSTLSETCGGFQTGTQVVPIQHCRALSQPPCVRPRDHNITSHSPRKGTQPKSQNGPREPDSPPKSKAKGEKEPTFTNRNQFARVAPAQNRRYQQEMGNALSTFPHQHGHTLSVLVGFGLSPYVASMRLIGLSKELVNVTDQKH
jgi:hypothetical protein